MKRMSALPVERSWAINCCHAAVLKVCGCVVCFASVNWCVCVCVCARVRDCVIFVGIFNVNAYIWVCLNMYACVSVCMRLCFD